MLNKSLFLNLCSFVLLGLFTVDCQQSKLNSIEPAQTTTYPPTVNAVIHNKTTLKLTGTNLDSTSSVKLSGADGTSQTLSISSKSASDVVVAPSSNFTFNLDTIYSLLVKNAYGETSVSFTVDLTNVAAGAFAVGTSYLTVTSSGAVGIGTATPTSGAILEISGSGATASSVLLPRDTTANRPSGVNGMIRYNTTTNKFEVFENSAWATLHEVKCAAQQLNLSYKSGTTYYQCIAMMPSTSAGTNSVTSVDDDGVSTTGTACALGDITGSLTGTLVTLGSSPSICRNYCTLTANCNSSGQWTNLTATSL